MLEQIQEVVRKNLPAEVGDQLKKHLEAAESTARRLVNIESELQDTKKQRDLHLVRAAELEGKLKLAGDLDKREKDVTQREIKLEVTRSNDRAEAAHMALGKIENLVMLVFRNPKFITTEQNSVPIAVPGQSYPSTAAGSKHIEKTTE